MRQGCVVVVDPGEGYGGAAPPPLFLDQTEAQRAKKELGGRPGLPPLFQGLDLALCCFGGGRQN